MKEQAINFRSTKCPDFIDVKPEPFLLTVKVVTFTVATFRKRRYIDLLLLICDPLTEEPNPSTSYFLK